MSKEEILEEWLRQTDQTYINKGHKMVILNAMEEYAKQQVSKLPIHGISGRFYSDTEIAILKEECYQDGIEEGEMNE